MTMLRLRHARMGLASLISLMFACACSGGGGGSGGDPANAVLMSVVGENPGLVIYSGSDTTPPNCTAGVPANGAIRFRFGGAVDPASLPADGPMLGPISITLNGSSGLLAAEGVLRVEDDPNFPPGNRRQVVFIPRAPTSVAAANSGMAPSSLYDLVLPAAPAPAVVIDGIPLQQPVSACFSTCPFVGTGACFGDGVPGDPFIVSTNPATADAAGTPIATNSLPSGQIRIIVSEGLDGAGFGTASIQVVDVATSAPVPGVTAYIPPGSAGDPLQSTITFEPSSGLAPDTTYRVEIAGALTDFAGNPLRLYDPAIAALERRFATEVQPYIAGTPLVENFDTTTNRAAANSLIRWEGNGILELPAPDTFFGDGSFGPLVFAAGPTAIDTGMASIPNGTGGFAFDRGVWNTDSIDVMGGASVRVTGDYPVRWFSTGTVNIGGIVDVSAAMAPPLGPASGIFNQGGSVATSIVRGGAGGPGAGDGGRASQQGFTVRTAQAETGFGMRDDGAAQPGIGGRGGTGSFFFPAGGTPGDTGGQGGAGGAAFTQGEAARRFSPLNLGCMVLANQGNAIPSAPTPVPAAFVTPVMGVAAGSGGGGGGDRWETVGVMNDDQGGGGGGGGGGLRIAACDNIIMGPAASLLAQGADGGQGNNFFGGGGGGGSGGMIWLRSANSVSISSSTTLNAAGGAAANLCTPHTSGAGGDGLIQLEDADGIVNQGFSGGGQSNVVTLSSPITTEVVGSASTTFFDTQSIATDYTSIDVISSLGSIAGAAILVEAQGARESVSGGAPDLAQLSPRVPMNMIDDLDGYRYIRVFIRLSYPVPSASNPLPPGSTFPSVNSFTVNYNIPDPLPSAGN